MGLTQAMLVGFTGIKSNQFMIDAVGDNVANVNTTAFKNQRALFETVFYRTIDAGSGPDAATNNGGTNPVEVGLGSRLAALQRSFEQGSIQGTGLKSDVAVDGAGFFILENADGGQLYTRDGALQLDENNDLVSSAGLLVQGFAADESGEIIAGTLSNSADSAGHRKSGGRHHHRRDRGQSRRRRRTGCDGCGDPNRPAANRLRTRDGGDPTHRAGR
jgi:flagellar hook protein FlgE